MMNEQQKLARKAARLAGGPIWQQRPHEHLAPKRFPAPGGQRLTITVVTN
jgi:hypothetical protein